MASKPSPSRSRTVVLGAEPDPVTRALIGLYLEPHGYRVRIAPTVAEALATAETEPLGALVCSEQALAEATAEARAALRERTAGVPVVVLLEPGAVPVESRGWPGAREPLTKPVRADALLSVLHGTRPSSVARPVLNGRAESVEPSSGEPLAGFHALISEMEMDGGMVRELVVSFLERAPAYLNEIAEGLAQGDLAGVDRVAHTMKGMCGNLRFERLVTLSDGLRRAAREGDADMAERGLGDLHAELERVSAAVRAQWPV